MIARSNRIQLGLALLAFLGLCALVALTTKNEVMLSGNESSRLAAAQSFVDHGTFAIGHSVFQTVDKIRIDGRFYSDKPVFLLYWLALVYRALHVLGGLGFQTSYHLTIYLVTLIGISVFTPLLSFFFFWRLRAAGFPFRLQIFGSAAVVLATWIFSYGGTVNNHTPAACALFALYWMLDAGGDSLTPRKAFRAGLLTGLLFNLEIPIGIIFFLAGMGWMATRRGLRHQLLASYAAGFALLVLLMLMLDDLAYGTVLPPFLIHGGKQFAGNIHSLDIGGNRRPLGYPGFWFDITFGDRGFFSEMPALLFALPALADSIRRDKTTMIWPIALAVTFAFFGCFAGDYGGWAYGFRYLVPLIPILFWFALCWFREKRSGLLSAAFYLTCLVGLVIALVGAYNPWPAVYEGAATPPNAIEQKVRNPFTANLLCWSFERDPDSLMTRYLAEGVFDPKVTRAYLPLAYTNMKRPDLVELARERFR